MGKQALRRVKSKVVPKRKMDALLEENDELMAIFTASAKTAKKRMGKMKKLLNDD